jgi:Zn-dependent protease
MLFSFKEIFDIVVMTLAIGFIFRDVFHYTPKVEVFTPEDLLKTKKGWNWNDFWFAAAVVAPSIILHEFGHKFMAIAFGMSATFQAAYTWLGIGIALKLIGFPFVFFVPAFTAITGVGTNLQLALVSFAGPAVNLCIWLIALIIMKTNKKLNRNAYHFLYLISRINMFLFIFNMLPIPMFDGYSVFSNLAKAFL